MKRWISLLLCAAMIFSLCACTAKPQETTPTTEPTVPPTTTEPAPTASEIFSAAAEKVNTAKGALVTYTIDKQMILGNDTYLETEENTLSLSAPGTENFISSAKRSFTWGEDGAYETQTADHFSQGNFYSKLGNYTASAEMTVEEYTARYLPAVLFTPDLYTDVVFTDDSTISFSGATELEPWLNSEIYTLSEASGTAMLNSKGEIEECTYHVVFFQGNVEHIWDINLTLMTGTVDVSLPYAAEEYPASEMPDAMLAYERAIGFSLQARDYTSSIITSVLIEAGAALLTQQTTVNNYGTGKNLVNQTDLDVTLLDLSSQEAVYTVDQQEIYKNGVYSMSEDGGVAVPNRAITAEQVEFYTTNILSENFLLPDAFSVCTPKDLGSLSLVTFTLDEKTAKAYTTTPTGMIYNDANLLNDLASAYRTDKGELYLGINNVTGLPTSLGISYTGIHTIEGQECRLVYELSQNFTFGTGEGYEAVMEEMPPAEEPEEKATPLLYHVTGENGEEMWLFGTIHVGDERMAFLPQEVLDAFNASDALAVEFDDADFEEEMEDNEELIKQIQECYFYTDGTTTKDHISDEGLYNAAIELLKATGQYYSTVEMMKPSLLANLIENAYMNLGRQLYSQYGADNTLMQMAREQEKEILSVESAEFQIGMLTGYSDALQEQLLLEAVESDPYEYQAGVLELYEMWCSGDEAALIAYLNTEADTSEMTEEELALYEEYWTAMSTARNDDMLDVAVGYLTGDKLVFYAVGLAHLLAEDGLVNTLRDAGYTVELVVYG